MFRLPMGAPAQLGSMGSTTALSMAANPAALIPIAVGVGVVATIGAAVWTYEAYLDYKNKKLLEEIELVNKLHHQYLERIDIFETHEIRGFPKIFNLPEKKPNEKQSAQNVECIRFTDDDIADMGKNLTGSVDISLIKYREYINDAILKLKDYYLRHTGESKKNKKDPTTAVLAYLLYMLETKCLNFSGYEIDNAYLYKLTEFINAYASRHGTKNTEDFSRLDPVRQSLLLAKQELEQHKEMMSLKDLVSSMSQSSMAMSTKLIRIFARFIIPEDNWRFIETATFSEMMEGIVRREYVHHDLYGWVLAKDKAVGIPESHFKPWLHWLLAYYEESINPDSAITTDDIKAPEEVFPVPDLSVLTKQGKFLNSANTRRQIKQTREQLASIRRSYMQCKNFISVKLDTSTENSSSSRFVSVTQDIEIVARTKVLADIAALGHQVISMQYLCAHLLKSLQQLGEIYVKNPNHFNMVFDVLGQLSHTIDANVDGIRKSITAIQKQNHNVGQLIAQEQFPLEVLDLLGTIDTSVSRINGHLQEYRQKIIKQRHSEKAETESVKHEMFEVARLFADIFHMKDVTKDLTPSTSETESLGSSPKVKKHRHHDEAASHNAGSSILSKAQVNTTPKKRSFWQRHKYKIMGGVLAVAGVLTMGIAFTFSIASGGLLSPLGAIVAATGAKIGLAGLALAGVDALFGLVIGLGAGTLINGAVAASKAIERRFSGSSKKISNRLGVKPGHSAHADPAPANDGVKKRHHHHHKHAHGQSHTHLHKKKRTADGRINIPAPNVAAPRPPMAARGS